MAHSSQRIQLMQLEKMFFPTATTALCGLTTTIQSQGVTGIVGPDGAGKTTLLRLMAGLLLPTAGTLRVIGLDPITQQRELHNQLGYMPQKFGLYEDLTVIENLDLYSELKGLTHDEKEQRYEKLLSFTSLHPFLHRLAGKLSGGMKQKLGLACTLLGYPKVLLLDEPSVGVDPISRRELWQMVHELADEGMLILWSTSYLDEAEQCQEILLLNEGKLLYQGIPAHLTQQMENRCLLATSASLSNRQLLLQALQLPQVNDGVIQGRAVRLVINKENTLSQLSSALELSDCTLTATAPRFEDAFIDLLAGTPTRESSLAQIMPQVVGSTTDIVIEAKQLTKRFGAFAATDQVNFQVKRGEIFGLLGPNGAGKSTTFKMMCGLLQPTEGEALVLGLDLKKSSAQARQRLGYMAQKFSLYSKLTVQQNLLFFSGTYGLRGRHQRRKVDEMIDAFNFSAILHQPPEALPLGFKQRLALACALMHEPDILFLDEPTSGVDPLTRREFWLHINGLVNKGVTVMVTTHFMDEAEYCDQIGLVYRGKLIASGSPDELKQQCITPQQPYPSMEQTFINLVQSYDLEER